MILIIFPAILQADVCILLFISDFSESVVNFWRQSVGGNVVHVVTV